MQESRPQNFSLLACLVLEWSGVVWSGVVYVVLTEWSMLSVWTDTDLDISRHRSRQCSYQPYHQHPSLSCRDISFLTKLLCLTLIKSPSLLDMACTGIKTLPSLCPVSLWLESWRIRTCVSVCYLNNK